MEIKVHPAAEIFPLMDKADLSELTDSIKKNGLLYPILLYDDKIIDGRNRALACEVAGVSPRYARAPIDGDPYEWVWITNAERRHLTQGQRAAIKAKQIASSKEWQAAREEEERRRRSDAKQGNKNAAKNKEPSNEGTLNRPTRKRGTAAKAASEAGVSRATMERAIALQKADPELAEKVGKGEMTISSALSKARGVKRISLSLAEDLHGRIKAYSLKHNLSMSASIAKLCRKALGDEGENDGPGRGNQ